MKARYLIAAAVAAVVAAAPSYATVAIQVVNGGAPIVVPPSFTGVYGTTTSATDTAVLYQFTLGSSFVLSQATFTNVEGFALNSVAIYAGTQTSQQSNASALFGPTAAMSSDFASAPTVVLNAGSYTIQVNGTANGASGVGSTLRFSAAPEPATWGLMVLGFGAVGGALRTSRRKVVFA